MCNSLTHFRKKNVFGLNSPKKLSFALRFLLEFNLDLTPAQKCKRHLRRHLILYWTKIYITMRYYSTMLKLMLILCFTKNRLCHRFAQNLSVLVCQMLYIISQYIPISWSFLTKYLIDILYILFTRSGDIKLLHCIQSTLVISKSKRPSETLRDIRTSTYQICRTEENTNRTTKFHKRTFYLTPLVRNICGKYCGKGEKFLLFSTIFCYLM